VIRTPAQRRQRGREQTKSDILKAARAVIREQGVAALNLQEVARRVGMRAPSLYEYFPSKAALYDSLFLLGTRAYARRLARVAWDPDQVWQSMTDLMHAYLSFAQQSTELFHLVFERHVPGFAPSDASMQEARVLLAGGYQKFHAAVERGGLVPDTSPEAAFDLFVALMHGLASQHLANEPDLPVGSGRFGSLIPRAVAVLRAAWSPTKPTQS
jgi:AcrR family transcriptional regulator